MKSKVIVWVAFALAGCEIIYDNDDKELPYNSLDAGVVLASRYVSHSGTELVMEADIVLLDHYSWGDDLPFFGEDEFSVDGEGGTYEIISFLDDQVFDRAGEGAAVILIDQSGNYETADPYNYRAKGLNKFLQKSHPQYDHLIGGFSKDGALANEPVEYHSASFSTTWEDKLQFLFFLAKRTGGTNNVYDAIGDGLSRLKDHPANNRDLIVLAHSDDEVSNVGRQPIIDQALADDIRIHFITVGNDVDARQVGVASHTTGGMFASCPDYLSMVTVVGNLRHVLDGSPNGYTIRVRFVKSAGPIQPGEAVYASVKVTDQYSGYEFNPLLITVRVPE
ncbi:MAG TPA: hypothetical protein VEB86_15650 [Chryseosolibacter sp.]|nr:hypothetical protein [Chryseosolibacter sp.]